MPKVSVIMAVYNTQEQWLRDAIESILRQTFKDFEFIIINDGSTNNAENIILSYSDNRIKYIKQQNQGLGSAINNGLKIAKGEYIARMDSDDISLPERFEKQVQFLDDNPNISVLGTAFEKFPQRKVIIHPKNPKFLDLLSNCCIAHPSVMMRKSDLEKYNLSYNPDCNCEDYELWSRAVAVLKFANLEEVLLKYRWHKYNASKPTVNFQTQVSKVKKNMLDFLTDDKKLQQKILKLLKLESSEKISLLQKFFSIKITADKERKIITILGIKIKININANIKKYDFNMTIIDGGFGSQLCQWIFGKYLESINNTPIKFDCSWYESCGMDLNDKCNRKFCIENVFEGLKIPKATAEEISVFKKNYRFKNKNLTYYKKIKRTKTPKYYGSYYCNWEYFADQIEKIKKLKFQKNIIEKMKNTAKKIKNEKCPIAVHIRRGDYVNSLFDVVRPEYYIQSINYLHNKHISENPVFIFFSNDMNYVKTEIISRLPNIKYLCMEENGNDEGYNDFYLITNCKHYICSNSSFYSAAFFIQDFEQKDIIVPEIYMEDPYEIKGSRWYPSFIIIKNDGSKFIRIPENRSI